MLNLSVSDSSGFINNNVKKKITTNKSKYLFESKWNDDDDAALFEC